VERYAAVWNEPDRERRRRSIAELWAEDGAHFTPHSRSAAIETRVAGA
jgi:hypothetical protein